jgi:hypothetical protein
MRTPLPNKGVRAPDNTVREDEGLAENRNLPGIKAAMAITMTKKMITPLNQRFEKTSKSSEYAQSKASNDS